ncbi:MAG: helix-turn-helix domain-containing protein [Streptosporangiales bacterium]|nr:helix-turn-helix domain-containing protein [Streptosporangiales bacterium]
MADQGDPRTVTDADPRELTDAAALRALRHPLRQRMLRLLDRNGPATATTLARDLGENSGATSYHLRRLAEHGFVEDDAERGHGRERWWRVGRPDIRFPPRSRMSRDLRQELGRFEQDNAAADTEALARFERARDSLGEWGDVLLFARGELQLDLAGARRFWDEYMELFNRYAAAERPADGRTVLVRFMAFPDVD